MGRTLQEIEQTLDNSLRPDFCSPSGLLKNKVTRSHIIPSVHKQKRADFLDCARLPSLFVLGSHHIWLVFYKQLLHAL